MTKNKLGLGRQQDGHKGCGVRDIRFVIVLAAAILVQTAIAGEPAVYPEQDPRSIILPESPPPAIVGPRIVGASAGKPFLFLIPATGQGPLTFSAENLPAGLSLDSRTGIISGALAAEGRYVSRLVVTGPHGQAARNLVVVGAPDAIALTPPMGWNSWYVWGLDVSDELMRTAADSIISSGLAAHGYQYVNIDDGWEKGLARRVWTPFGDLLVNGPQSNGRDADGEILTNEKFPDMAALADHLHARGLKFGIYTSPGPFTCGGYQGSYRHENQDAQTFARWGVDFVKYDWCTYTWVAGGAGRAQLQKPYAEMGAFLRAAPRDMVFSLCQYGMKNVWEWGESVGGNLWRTHDDLHDEWNYISKAGFDQDRMAAFAGPGHWNDPDMLMVGTLGKVANLHPSNLSPDEQITQVTLWSLAAAPLLISCDLTALDPFTRALLTNDEVIAVDQDPLGQAARRIITGGETEVWSRPLWDGTLAVGLFNRGIAPAEVNAPWSALGLSGPQPVRDLWRHQDLGPFNPSFSARIPPHGALLLKIGAAQKRDYLP
jgi:alpha-galactosidase